MADMVQRVITGVDRKQIPSGQYQAVLIDEGHDFAPEWLKLVTQMVDPTTNSLLVLYDDAQSIYERARNKQFSFKSVGMQAQGRTTILKINYRNTARYCKPPAWWPPTCSRPTTKTTTASPWSSPSAAGARASAHHHQTAHAARRSICHCRPPAQAHKEGHAWGDMAVLCPDWTAPATCAPRCCTSARCR
jgi:superfamily I DNA/RNA helicase